MPDDVQTGADAPQPGQDTTQKPDMPEVETPDDLKARIEKLERALSDANREAKQRKIAKREAEAAAAKAEEDRLKEQQKYQELADRYAKELEALRPQADKVARYEEAFLATLAKRLEALPDTWKSAVPDFGDPVKTMEWLDSNAHLFQTRQMPNIDAGAGNTPSPKGTPQLTALELELAKSFGMTPEDYIKFREKGNATQATPDR